MSPYEYHQALAMQNAFGHPDYAKVWEPYADNELPFQAMKSRKVRIYIIGSLRSPRIPEVAHTLREAGYEVFDDWYAAGPDADDEWQTYEQGRGRTYAEALKGYAAEHVFTFDKRHLDLCDIAVLVGPAGKSGHLELGYCIGRGKRGLIYLPDGEPERWDVMYRFAESVSLTEEELLKNLELGGI